MAGDLFCEIEHYAEWDAEANKWSSAHHNKNHAEFLEKALKIRPKLDTIPGFGKSILVWWARNKKPGTGGYPAEVSLFL